MYKRHDASSKCSVYLLRTKIFTEQKTFSGHPRIYRLEFMSHQHQKELELNIKYMYVQRKRRKAFMRSHTSQGRRGLKVSEIM